MACARRLVVDADDDNGIISDAAADSYLFDAVFKWCLTPPSVAYLSCRDQLIMGARYRRSEASWRARWWSVSRFYICWKYHAPEKPELWRRVWKCAESFWSLANIAFHLIRQNSPTYIAPFIAAETPEVRRDNEQMRKRRLRSRQISFSQSAIMTIAFFDLMSMIIGHRPN